MKTDDRATKSLRDRGFTAVETVGWMLPIAALALVFPPRMARRMSTACADKGKADPLSQINPR